ncbi:MAG TPA: nuclear transport factor 2 family protein [Streptosporangiaceae bacterium]|nr:nuclear transport factor 2 family protein [Streptosporangiaceae bacterium]
MDLVELEEIRQLKYRYLRCVDLKLWDEIGDVFTQDATADYGTPSAGRPLDLKSRDDIVAFLRDSLGNGIITLHAAGQPEIQIDGDHATGTWRFEDTVIATEFKVVICGAAFYEDRYVKCADGKWRMSHTGYVRIYESTMSLDDLPSWKLTANRWGGGPGGSSPQASTG